MHIFLKKVFVGNHVSPEKEIRTPVERFRLRKIVKFANYGWQDLGMRAHGRIRAWIVYNSDSQPWHVQCHGMP